MSTFKFPAGVLAQHMIAIGKTGSGKSSKLRIFVEHLLRAGEPVIILDVKGDWWGIKSSANGKEPGFPVVIFGGKHADLPLNAAAGKELAEVVCSGNRPCVIDMRGLSHRDRSQLFIDFVSTAYRINKGKRYIVISEVHNFAFKGKVFSPQAGEMLHWANTLASEGRGLGLTVLADSQRGQKVHNDFLTSMETLIACKVIHKSDRDAIKDWIDGCADIEVGKQVLASLAQLKKPEAWMWCPEIDYGPERVTFPLFSTFDSFKPQELDAPAQLKGWATVDLEELKGKLVTVLEEAQANDPAVLKKKIAELQRQIKAATPEGAYLKRDIDQAFNDGKREGVAEAVRANEVGFSEGWKKCAGDVRSHLTGLIDRNDAFITGLEAAVAVLANPPATVKTDRREYYAPTKVPHSAASKTALNGLKQLKTSAAKFTHNGHAPASALPKGEIAVLSACIQYPDGLRREQITVLTGFKRSTRDAYVYRLKEKGFVEVNGETVTATEDGILALPNAEPLPRGEELQQFWLNKLPQGERLILEQLIEVYPKGLARDEVTERTGFKRSTRDAYIYRMASKQIVTEPIRGEVRASEDLF